jgi:hypothetical protein
MLVEFFRLFPKAHDFRVSTAIRMSASFRWVSPAINLPTLPPRRVVDAAYYDNHGVNLSALWLSRLGGWARVHDDLTGRDSYEFHKWRIDNRNSPTFHRDLKGRYDRELRALGITGTKRLTAQESQSLHENVIKNLKRLELLADWWAAGSVMPEPTPPPTAAAD